MLHTVSGLELGEDQELIAFLATLKRSKGQYDGACQEVESRRKKIESSFDSRYAALIVVLPRLIMSSKSKAQSAYHQQQTEMNNVKVGLASLGYYFHI